MAAMENNLALAFLAIGNLPRAAEYTVEARRRFEHRMADRRWLAHVEDTGAMVALQEGRTEAALAMTERAIEHAEATGNEAALTSALRDPGQRAQTKLGQTTEAQDSYARAADLRPQWRTEGASARGARGVGRESWPAPASTSGRTPSRARPSRRVDQWPPEWAAPGARTANRVQAGRGAPHRAPTGRRPAH